MKKIFLLFALAAVSCPAIAQKGKKGSKSGVDQTPKLVSLELTPQERAAQQQQRMMGPEHHVLTQWAGHWRDEMKIWSVQGSEPVKENMERETRIICEGRFLFSNVMGMISQQRYEAQSTIGFDNTKRKFTKVWIDNLGTGTLVLEGTMDEKSNTVDFRGTTIDPMTRQEVKIHQILKINDPSSHTLEVYVEDKNGREFKTMEVISRRG